MPMTPGLVPNLRLVPEEQQPESAEDMIVEVSEGDPTVDMDEAGNILRIEHPDGSISISLDGKPIEQGESEAEKAKDWFRNLVDEIDPGQLILIANELMDGIKDDLDSRRDWIEDRAQGIKLLGLKLEVPGLQGASEGAPVEGMSKVRHPLLLEAVLRFQANARSELLPTDGPVKVRNDATLGSTIQQDDLANALQKDLNHYLTAVAKEYYPDTDRMLLMLGFGGSAFKKVYFCPLRNRPVSESVDADDLIVNNSATDLSNAKRITHRVNMRPSTVKRLQILGVYRDVDLGTPMPQDADAVQREKADQQGVTIETMKPDDRDREIYECYCELDIPGFEHKWKGKVTGLEIPYRVTIDVSSKEILSIVRNYDEDDEQLPTARTNFVKYAFVPGMGFYDIGLLHILGNTTNAVTAAWREMLDAGMFANFPGFLMADTGARQNTNIFRVPPGGGALVKTGGMPLSQAVMPLPYKEPGPAMMNLVTNMAETGARIGGTAEMAVGEGRQDAPVGTTLAMIDQATKVLNAVHKRLHSAQAEEFALLVRCFREHPESFWERNKRPTIRWNEQLLVQALNDCELVPQADPNTASQTQRIMKVMALKQMAAASPGMYDPQKVDTVALQTIGWSNPEQFYMPEEVQKQPPPQLQEAMARLQLEQQKADADAMRAQADAAYKQSASQVALMKAQAELEKAGTARDVAEAKLLLEAEKLKAGVSIDVDELENKIKDRQHKERMQMIDLAQNLAVHPESAPLVLPLAEPTLAEQGMLKKPE